MNLPTLRWVDRLHIAVGSFSALCLVAIMLIVTPDVIGRKLASQTIPGASELNTLLLVALIYFGMAAAEAKSAHFRVTLLTDAVSSKARHLLEIVNTAICMGFSGFLAWLTIVAAEKSWSDGEVTYGVIVFPIWPSRIAVAIGLSLLTIQFAVELYRLLTNRPAHALEAVEVDE